MFFFCFRSSFSNWNQFAFSHEWICSCTVPDQLRIIPGNFSCILCAFKFCVFSIHFSTCLFVYLFFSCFFLVLVTQFFCDNLIFPNIYVYSICFFVLMIFNGIPFIRIGVIGHKWSRVRCWNMWIVLIIIKCIFIYHNLILFPIIIPFSVFSFVIFHQFYGLEIDIDDFEFSSINKYGS